MINQVPGAGTAARAGSPGDPVARSTVGHDDDHDRAARRRSAAAHDRCRRHRSRSPGWLTWRPDRPIRRRMSPIADRPGACTVVAAPEPPTIPALRRTRTPRHEPHPRATLIGIVLLGALFLFASFALGRFDLDGRAATPAVPRVTLPRSTTGRLADAQRILEALGLLVAVEYQSNELLPAGRCSHRSRSPARRSSEGGEVTLVVSDGPGGTPVPSITGVPRSRRPRGC